MPIITDYLRTLRLVGMLQEYENQQMNVSIQSMSFDDRLNLLIDQEMSYRQQRKFETILRKSKLKYPKATIEEIDYHHSRNLNKNLIKELQTCKWVTRHQNILIFGATGCGKTWLACALAHQAARQGYSLLYLRTTKLLEMLEVAHADGSLVKLRYSFSKVDILILDDFGISPMTLQGRSDLLELIEDRVNEGSLIITSQHPIESWYQIIGDPMLADAILDRLNHSSHKFNLAGDSMRKKMSI